MTNERKVIQMSSKLNIERVEGGYMVNGHTFLPFGFNPTKEIDPIAMHYLEELYSDPQVDVEFLAFTQTGTALYTPTHQLPITSEGVYLMRVVQNDTVLETSKGPDSIQPCSVVLKDCVQFVRVKWIDEIYKGTRREPCLLVEQEIPLGAHSLSKVQADAEAHMIRDTFIQTLKLTGKVGVAL